MFEIQGHVIIAIHCWISINVIIVTLNFDPLIILEIPMTNVEIVGFGQECNYMYGVCRARLNNNIGSSGCLQSPFLLIPFIGSVQ